MTGVAARQSTALGSNCSGGLVLCYRSKQLYSQTNWCPNPGFLCSYQESRCSLHQPTPPKILLQLQSTLRKSYACLCLSSLMPGKLGGDVGIQKESLYILSRGRCLWMTRQSSTWRWEPRCPLAIMDVLPPSNAKPYHCPCCVFWLLPQGTINSYWLRHAQPTPKETGLCWKDRSQLSWGITSIRRKKPHKILVAPYWSCWCPTDIEKHKDN